jgi:hypothetical protein
MARLLLDGMEEFVVAADWVPESGRDQGVDTLNSAAWVVNHVGESVDTNINVHIGGGVVTRTWSHQLSYHDERAALSEVFDRAMVTVVDLTEDDIDRVIATAPARPGMPAPTVGVMLAGLVAHTYAHASELHAIIVAAGGRAEWQLPGGLDYVRGRLIGVDDVGRRVEVQFYDFDDLASPDGVLFERTDHVVRQVEATVEGVSLAGRVVDRVITIRRDDGMARLFRQERVRCARFLT